VEIPAVPQPGMVLCYAYLWLSEHEQGMEEGRKDRPAAVVMTLETEATKTEVLTLPITHTPPEFAYQAVEIPPATKQRLGLDDQRSWIVLTEVNIFAWPGPDLRPISRGQDTCLYGILPHALLKIVREKFLALHAHGRIRHVPRTE
jgi:hypothetical protein